MSERERWIVYPLLFMALGMAAAPKLAPGEGRFTRVICESLVAKSAQVSGELDVGVVDANLTNTKRVQLFDMQGVPQAELVPTVSGGRLDIMRYSRSRVPIRPNDAEIFVQLADRSQVQLGVVRIREHPTKESAPEKNPTSAPEATNTPATTSK
jgi:hypothetical protein